MSERKKWRLKKIPSFTYESAPSMRRAYERVESLRDQYAMGVGRTHHVNVEVDEGSGWLLYEKIIFPQA
jgi:hypothetical protein